MKKVILGLEKEWMAILYGIMGLLLFVFPEFFAGAAPYMIGIGLIVYGIVVSIVFFKYKLKNDVKPGKIVLFIILGCATLYHNSDSIGAIGGFWAMLSLYEVSEEITESYEKKEFSVVRMIFSVITIALAIMLLFAPFEHFTVHVRILGLEMISYVFVRKHNLMIDKKKKTK